MAKAPVYQRMELPPGQTGMVKPPYELADRSGQIRFAQTVTGLAGDIWSQIIQADAINEEHEFMGKADARLAAFDEQIIKNPGQSFEQYEQWKKEALDDIRKAGQGARTGIAKARIRNWYARNEELLGKKMQASLEAIEVKRQEERFNLNRQIAIDSGDMARLKNIYFGSWNNEEQRYEGGIRGTLIDEKQADFMFEYDSMQLEAVRQRKTEQQQKEARLAEIRAVGNFAIEISGKGLDAQKYIQQEATRLNMSNAEEGMVRSIYDTAVRNNKEIIEQKQIDNEKSLYLQIIRREIADPAKLDFMLETGEISRAGHKELYKLMTEGAADNNDPESLMKSYEAIEDVRDGKRTARNAFDEILGYSTKLKDTTFDGLIPKLFPTDEKADPLSKETVKTYTTLLKKLREDGDFGKTKNENALGYNKAYEELTKWVENNPDATPQQLDEKFSQIVKPAVSFSLWNLIKKIFDLRGREYVATKGTTGQSKAELREPRDVGEFEFEVERIAQDDKEAARKYYDKWKDKW